MRRMRKCCLLLLVCLLTLSGCTSVPSSLYEISKSKDNDKISLSEKEEKTDLQSCTVNQVTFSVSKELKPMEQDGAFTTKDQTVVYHLQGTSPMGSQTPEEVYEELKEFYDSSYEVVASDDGLSYFQTADNLDAQDYITGNTFIGGDDSELCLKEDGSFDYYQVVEEHDGPRYVGTYEVYYGQDAIDKVVSMSEYGVTEEELEQTLSANMNGYKVGGI